MTRHFNLIREILFQVEKAPGREPFQTLSFDHEVSDRVVGEHLELLIEGGLLDGEVLSYEPLCFVIRRLTWGGHDFLENARNDTVWKKVMAEAKSKGTSMTMTVLNALLSKAAQRYAGLG